MLTAFLADPEPFLAGARELVAAPLQEVARRTNWTAVLMITMSGGVLLTFFWWRRRYAFRSA